ncbi:IncI1 plasmid conjugative transfer protein TraH [plant metagenome]|uniref:IncI1 plasmid conjugative transfer protein TraH n=1 Tax=plant metagenome TaxID=1297885 RepID=A0A484U2R1_9ZZZZ
MITLNWAGDALQLLAKLAHDHRLTFAFTGVRLPLPVRLDVQNSTIESVIAQVRAQIGYRAQIVEQGEGLLLQYNPPRP